MDLDWCLTCNQHTSGAPYCSEACRLSELANSTTVSTPPTYTLYSSQSSAEPSATSRSFYQPRHTSPGFTSMRSGSAFPPQPQQPSTSAPLQQHVHQQHHHHHHQLRSQQAWMSHQYQYRQYPQHRQVRHVSVMI